jgi:hypothetical protein
MTSLLVNTRASQRIYAIGVGMFAVLGTSLMVSGAWSTVEAMGVQPMDLPWADARTISGAGIAMEQGLDPLVNNPGDPWQRVMNYPRLWLALAEIGFRPEHTWILAWSFFAALIVGLITLRPLARDRTTSSLLLLSIFAPTTWLALERANNDTLVFGMLAGAAYLIARRPAMASALIAAAIVLKIYPIFALLAFLRDKPNKAHYYTIAVFLLFAAYVAVIWQDLQLIKAGTLKADWIAYGIEIAPSIIAKNSSLSLGFAIALGALGLLISCAIGYRIRLRTRLGAAGTAFSLAAFRIGSAIYLGSFLIGSNFDYRLIFLILTIPQLVIWARSSGPEPRMLASGQLMIIMLLQWSQTWRAGVAATVGSTNYGLAIDEILTWLCWTGLAVLSILTLPDWLVPQSRRGLIHADSLTVNASLNTCAVSDA